LLSSQLPLKPFVGNRIAKYSKAVPDTKRHNKTRPEFSKTATVHEKAEVAKNNLKVLSWMRQANSSDDLLKDIEKSRPTSKMDG